MTGVRTGPHKHQYEDRTLVGIPYWNFLTMLCRSQDFMKFKYIKGAFEAFDCDENGRITEDDIMNAINPLCLPESLRKKMFTEISTTLKEDVSLQGINLFQFRNILLRETDLQQKHLCDFIESNKSMVNIKECRELATMSPNSESFLQRQNRRK